MASGGLYFDQGCEQPLECTSFIILLPARLHQVSPFVFHCWCAGGRFWGFVMHIVFALGRFGGGREPQLPFHSRRKNSFVFVASLFFTALCAVALSGCAADSEPRHSA